MQEQKIFVQSTIFLGVNLNYIYSYTLLVNRFSSYGTSRLPKYLVESMNYDLTYFYLFPQPCTKIFDLNYLIVMFDV